MPLLALPLRTPVSTGRRGCGRRAWRAWRARSSAPSWSSSGRCWSFGCARPAAPRRTWAPLSPGAEPQQSREGLQEGGAVALPGVMRTHASPPARIDATPPPPAAADLRAPPARRRFASPAACAAAAAALNNTLLLAEPQACRGWLRAEVDAACTLRLDARLWAALGPRVRYVARKCEQEVPSVQVRGQPSGPMPQRALPPLGVRLARLPAAGHVRIVCRYVYTYGTPSMQTRVGRAGCCFAGRGAGAACPCCRCWPRPGRRHWCLAGRRRHGRRNGGRGGRQDPTAAAGSGRPGGGGLPL